MPISPTEYHEQIHHKKQRLLEESTSTNVVHRAVKIIDNRIRISDNNKIYISFYEDISLYNYIQESSELRDIIGKIYRDLGWITEFCRPPKGDITLSLKLPDQDKPKKNFFRRLFK